MTEKKKKNLESLDQHQEKDSGRKEYQKEAKKKERTVLKDPSIQTMAGKRKGIVFPWEALKILPKRGGEGESE